MGESFIVHRCEQRSQEWDDLRRGRITASLAKKLVTPTGKVSTTYRGEIGTILAEAMGWQEPEFFNKTYWMERGVDLEAEARGMFQAQTGLMVEEVGFVSHTVWQAGASPDGINLDKRYGAELKCPKPSTHIQWLQEFRKTGDIPKEHLPQCHFGMAITGWDTWHFMSYHPEAPDIIATVKRNEMTELMEKQLAKFTAEFSEVKALLIGD